MRMSLALVVCGSMLGACSGSDGNSGVGSTAGVTGSTLDGGGAGTNGNAGAGAGGGAGNGSGSSGGPTGAVPMFPGAGTSDDAKPLVGGMVCDEVPGATINTVKHTTRCFQDKLDKTKTAATIEQVLECADSSTVLHLRLTFAPWFNDNTYGVNSIGWEKRKKGHTFRDLEHSDHAELVLINGDGDVSMQFKMDYISEDPSAPSGYSALGVTGGEGEIEIGDAKHILDASTSLDRNLNERGYDQYLVDSPATDENFTENPAAPDWDYRVVFDVWVDLEAFGPAGFSGAFIEYVHASPSKNPDDTIETEPGECPPDWDPCLDENPDTVCSEQPPGEDPCTDGDPDTVCFETPSDGGMACPKDSPDPECSGDVPPPPPGEPAYCERYPTDPLCTPD